MTYSRLDKSVLKEGPREVARLLLRLSRSVIVWLASVARIEREREKRFLSAVRREQFQNRNETYMAESAASEVCV